MLGGLASPVITAIIGAVIKMCANYINSRIEQKKYDRMYMISRDNETLDMLSKHYNSTITDPFVKTTRRILFLMITFTMCFLMIYYALNPNIQYTILVPNETTTSVGILSWLFPITENNQVVVKLTGGLMLSSFMDICFMIIGFYAIPGKR